MNLLAHLHLSEGAPAGVAAGNLLADYMRRLNATAPDRDFEAGLRLHYAIDAFAEKHPLAREARACIAPPRRRLAGIIVDVAFDHVLSREWRRYSPVPLESYVAARLETIRSHLERRPPPLHDLVRRAMEEEWLLEYGTPDGLRRTFDRIARRSPAAAGLRGAEEEIDRHGERFLELFSRFYPQLLARHGGGGGNPAPRTPPA